MSLGLIIAIRAVPFLDLLDREVESVASDLAETGDRAPSFPTSRMDTSRRRLAHAIDAFVRSLPASIRNDTNMSRATAYALVALADERMIHHPADGMAHWRDHLLEYDLYGSALAGQEIVARARASTYGAATGAGSGSEGDSALLAPLYLGIFRAGFEGGLRGDGEELSALISALEDTIGANRNPMPDAGIRRRPRLAGAASPVLMLAGALVWLLSGVGLWATLPQDALRDAGHLAGRISAGLPAVSDRSDPLEHSIGPSGLPALRDSPLLLRMEDVRSDPPSSRSPPPYPPDATGREAGAEPPTHGQPAR